MARAGRPAGATSPLGLALTGHFLLHHVLVPQGRGQVPAARPLQRAGALERELQMPVTLAA